MCFNPFEWFQVEEIANKLKGRYRSEIGPKTEQNRVKAEQKQGSTRLRSLRKSSAKLALCCQIIPQLIWLLCENFGSCETDIGTRVPLRSTGAPISQLRNGCEAIKRENPWFRNQSSILQGISQLRKRFWHTCATSQHSDTQFAAAKQIAKWLRKWFFAAKLAFFCETQNDH